jgi:predicted RNase H-like HicB family nuclease
VENYEHIVVYEQGDTNRGAFVPDLPGCVSIGDTFGEVQQNVKEAKEVYLEELQAQGQAVPAPKHRTGSVMVAT